MRQIKTPKRFKSNAFAFSPKRKYILLKTQGRFTSNALAFETKRTCVFQALLESSLEASLKALFLRFFLLCRLVLLYRCRKNLPVTDRILQYLDGFFQISIIFQPFHRRTTLIEIAGHDFL